MKCRSNLTASIGNSLVKFQDCSFINNTFIESVIKIESKNTANAIKKAQPKILIYITGCIFQSNDTDFLEFSSQQLGIATLYIEQTSFVKSFAIMATHYITLYNVKVVLKGPVNFTEIYTMLCLLNTNSEIGYIEFSNIKTENLICGSENFRINIMESTHIKLRNNEVSECLFYIKNDERSLYQYCYFQFYKINKNYNSTATNMQIIEIITDNASSTFDENTRNINCKSYSDSLYFNPLKVYPRHFKFTQSTNLSFPFDTGLLCMCQGSHKNCYTNSLTHVYPGQELKLKISLNTKITNENTVPITVKVYDNDFPHVICKVSSLLEAEQVVYQNCTEVTYNILSDNTKLCKLILYNANYKFPTVYFIKLLNCPLGFSYNKLEKKCICDEKLQSALISIRMCNINNQTILRPANSWISAITHKNSHSYQISVHCPFHYCLHT